MKTDLELIVESASVIATAMLKEDRASGRYITKAMQDTRAARAVKLATEIVSQVKKTLTIGN